MTPQLLYLELIAMPGLITQWQGQLHPFFPGRATRTSAWPTSAKVTSPQHPCKPPNVPNFDFQFKNYDLSFLRSRLNTACDVQSLIYSHVNVIISLALIKIKYDCNKSTNKSQRGCYRNTNEGSKLICPEIFLEPICNLISSWNVGVINAWHLIIS